ncbi:MAG: zinc ABC transporter substrate-binding protein [Candidatus Rokubacteria bacterium]|nr:zinc ABC transporter substrate-binding protein [Candidatus Rokubacteria bacterium]
MQARSRLTGLAIVLTAVGLVGGAATAHDDNTLPRPDPRSSGPTLNVVATLEHYGAIAKVIGGDRVKVSVIVKGSQNPHTVAVKPSYSVLFNRADLLVANGQLIELGWLDIALINARNAKIQEGHPGFVNCSIGVDIIPYTADEIEGTPFFILNLGAGGTLRLGNHHYWLDPGNSTIIARNIADKLAAVDLPNAAYYRGNQEHFAMHLAEKLKEWDTLMEPFRGMQLVSYHRSWNYLLRRHGVKVFDYIEPKETLPPSAAYMASLVDRMKRSGVKVILAETYQNRPLIDEIARQTGARALILPSSISEDQGIKTVFEFFDRIYGEIAPALRAAKTSS